MIEILENLESSVRDRFDRIIDVRSPGEFAEDHIPGAINLPVLSNRERAEVGTVYKQTSPFHARRIGAAYVAQNIARHLEGALNDAPKNFRPLIYCWRGGMRSSAMATIFDQVGWRTAVIAGGYKNWRRMVVAALRNHGPRLNIVLLDGQTGTAKTKVLQCAAAQGVQTIDLETLANHRGSVFGNIGAQPSQKRFETGLYAQLERFDLTRPILIEAESHRIGRCEIPTRVWESMIEAPRIVLSSPPEARADFLLNTYADNVCQNGAAGKAVDRLSQFHSRETIDQWRGLADAGQFRTLALALMRQHYDPLYNRSRAQWKNTGIVARHDLARLNSPAFEEVAEQIASTLSRHQT
ncbi:tRNA 2-selenouridine(34) synthase MnmH [Hyphococcus sp.]|uniref:tRNA 2-selenouridine(34) synthase MnmH n=1 Tax=Hyphococcus sp. TaxID=2038636 RepID=UPI003CCBC96E